MHYDNWKLDNPYHEIDNGPDPDDVYDIQQEQKHFEQLEEFQQTLNYLIRREFDRCHCEQREYYVALAKHLGLTELYNQMRSDLWECS